jgi:hypothetical protein
VWMRLLNSRTFMERPLVTESDWQSSLSDPIPADGAAGPGPAFEYSRLGDTVIGIAQPSATPDDLQALSNNYRVHQNGNGLSFAAATSAYDELLASNRASLETLLADSKGRVTLRQELFDHRYTFTGTVVFVPGP